MHGKLLITILAAGASNRLGQPKQLVAIDGEPLLRRQCRVAIESGLAPVTVVCGCHADSCIAQIADLPVSTRLNASWPEGIASSIREAVTAALERNCNALLILHCDQYLITVTDLRELHAPWISSGGCRVCRARHEDYAGPPIIFPSTIFGQLMQLRGDEGARAVLSSLGRQAVIEVNMPNAACDLDLQGHLKMACQPVS